MIETQTAVRDPVFFRWHKYVSSDFMEIPGVATKHTTQLRENRFNNRAVNRKHAKNTSH